MSIVSNTAVKDKAFFSRFSASSNMALDIRLNQKLSQSLVMTPQLRQAIKLLALGREDCLAEIEKELLENPVLEEEGRVASTPLEKSEVAPQDNLQQDNFWQTQSRSNVNGEQHSIIEATVSNREGLDSHLWWQLRMIEMSEVDKEIANYIIGSIDASGYLQSSLAEIASGCSSEEKDVERVLEVVQSLDPIGVAARDLRECLLIQLASIGLDETLPGVIVCSYLGELERQKFDEIARKEKVTLDEIRDALHVIRSLDPRPGRAFSDEPPVYITPDVYVLKIGNELVVSLKRRWYA